MKKSIKSLLCVFLCTLMTVSLIPIQAYASGKQHYTGNASDLNTGDTFDYGMYPQSRVTDTSTIDSLNSISCDMTQYNYYKNADSDADTPSCETISMYYADIAYNGKAYRKVTISEYRPQFCSQDSSGDKSHQDDNGYNVDNTYYFLWEPIEWQVLSNAGSYTYVMSKMLLDSPYYHKYCAENPTEQKTWETCDLREWLNNDFYNLAFSSNEQDSITKTTIVNECSPFDSDIGGGSNTTDYIWILSKSETMKSEYGFSNLEGAYSDRTASGTDYAKCQGLFVDNGNGVNGLSAWWLRNPGSKIYQASSVYTNGKLQGSNNFYSSSVGVRPAFKLNKNIVLSGADIAMCRITGHDYVLQSSSVQETCTEAGHNDYKCSMCSATKTETIAALGHGYGEPYWNWADDYSSATATFTCTNCQHKEDVDAAVTREDRDGKHYAVGTAEFGGKTYTDERITDAFTNHSLSLDGSIGVNFYLNLTEEDVQKATVTFSRTVEGNEKTSSVSIKDVEKNSCGYKAPCPIPVAEMTYDITATLFIDGVKVETDTYSAKQYADVILSDDFKKSYAGTDSKSYENLEKLVKTMLDYGSKAQVRFNRNVNEPANGGEDYFTGEENIPNNASDMSADLSECGLEFVGTSVVYLSETTLRHYYRIVDDTKFTEEIQNGITFGGETVTFGRKDGKIFFDKKDIAASQLDTEYVIKINGHEYYYSALDYSALSYAKDSSSYSESTAKQLAASVYRYNQAANVYFND